MCLYQYGGRGCKGERTMARASMATIVLVSREDGVLLKRSYCPSLTRLHGIGIHTINETLRNEAPCWHHHILSREQIGSKRKLKLRSSQVDDAGKFSKVHTVD